jgi:HrpA-like RNA helicase
MEIKDQEKFNELLQDLLEGFEEAQKQNPDIDVDQYLAEKLSAQFGTEMADKVKESSEFIDDLDKNTAQVLEDTQYMRLDKWVEKNVFNIVPEQDREELAKGIVEASDAIVVESLKEFEEA